MGWIEQKYGWLPYWDERFRKPLDHLPSWDDRRAGEYEEDEVQRRSPFVVEGDDSREREEPSIFEQAERRMREDERGWTRSSPAQGGVDWVMPHSWDKETFVDHPVFEEGPVTIDDQWEYFDPEDPEFTQKVASRLTQFLNERLITAQELDEYLKEAYLTTRIPSRSWLELRLLKEVLEQGHIDVQLYGEVLSEMHRPGFDVCEAICRKKMLRCCCMLEDILDLVDNWISSGMGAPKGGRLEGYLIEVGRRDAIAKYEELPPPGGMTKQEWQNYRQVVESPSFGLGRRVSERELRKLYHANSKYDRLVRADGTRMKKIEGTLPEQQPEVYLERGRRITSGVWAVFREDIKRAISIAKEPGLVVFRRIKPAARNMPGVPGYTLDVQTVIESGPLVLMELMIHEPMHDLSRYGLWHKAGGGWKRVEDEIGWDVEPDKQRWLGGLVEWESQGDWEIGLNRFMSYLFYIMCYMPGEPDSMAKNRWESSLRKSRIGWD